MTTPTCDARYRDAVYTHDCDLPAGHDGDHASRTTPDTTWRWADDGAARPDATVLAATPGRDRTRLLHLLDRLRRDVLLPAERDLLADAVTAALAAADRDRRFLEEARRLRDQLGAELDAERTIHEAHHGDLANALGKTDGLDWPSLLRRVEQVVTADTIRNAPAGAALPERHTPMCPGCKECVTPAEPAEQVHLDTTGATYEPWPKDWSEHRAEPGQRLPWMDLLGVLEEPEQPAEPEVQHCCVCGSTHVAYSNYVGQPFCGPCAGCGCGQTPCVRTGTNDPAVSAEAAEVDAELRRLATLHEVQGHCPACGGTSLFLGDGGYITCSRLDCPQPDAASTLLERDPRQDAAPETVPLLDALVTELFATIRRAFRTPGSPS